MDSLNTIGIKNGFSIKEDTKSQKLKPSKKTVRK